MTKSMEQHPSVTFHHLVKKFPEFYWTKWSVTMFPRVCHLSLPSARL